MELKHEFSLKKAKTIRDTRSSNTNIYTDEFFYKKDNHDLNENGIVNGQGNGQSCNKMNFNVSNQSKSQLYNIDFYNQNTIENQNHKNNNENNEIHNSNSVRKTESLNLRLNSSNFKYMKDITNMSFTDKRNGKNYSFKENLNNFAEINKGFKSNDKNQTNVNNSNKDKNSKNTNQFKITNNGIIRKSRFLNGNHLDTNHNKKIVFADEVTNSNVKLKIVKDVACLKDVYKEEIKIKNKDKEPPCFDMCTIY